MNLKARKIEFVQEFFKLQSEEVIIWLKKGLRKKAKASDQRILEPMTREKLNKRIDPSESDFHNNQFKGSSELLDKYK